MRILPEFNHEGYVGNKSIKYPPSCGILNITINEELDRSKQIDKLYLNRRILEDASEIKINVGGRPIIRLPPPILEHLTKTKIADDWLEVFEPFDLAWLAFPQLQYHKVEIMIHLNSVRRYTYYKARTEVEEQPRSNLYVWNEGEEEQLVIKDGVWNDQAEVYDHSRIDELPT